MSIYRNILVFLIISLSSGYGQFLIPSPIADPPGEEDGPPLGGGDDPPIGGGGSGPLCIVCEEGPVSVSLSGPSSANVGDEDTYYVNIDGSGFHSSSTYSVISGGTIVSQSTGSVRVRWTSAGTRYVSGSAIVSGNYYLFSKAVTVNAPAPPSRPPTPSISTNTCGNKTLTRANPPSGVTYYWQTSSGGTSTSNSGQTYSVSSSRTVYLRARGNSSGLWSSSRSVSVTVNPRPGTPATPTASGNTCGSATATRGTPPAGITWYWQDSPLASSTANSSSTYTVTADGYVYLRARNNSSGCWSSSTSSVYLDVDDVPDMPPDPEEITGSCGVADVKVRIGQGRTTVGYYWQDEYDGVSTDNPAYQSNLFYTSGTYYLRARNGADCWSATAVFYIEVPPVPATPATPATAFTKAGGIELIRRTPTTGNTWYWQGTNSGGTSTSDSGTKYRATSSGTYYLRPKEDGEDCWGEPVAIPVTLQAQTPAAVTPVAQGKEAIDLSWSEAGNETAFIISRARQSAGPYTGIYTTPGGETTFTDRNVEAGTRYYYQVQAVVDEEYSVPSAPQSVQTANIPGVNKDLAHQPLYDGNISAVTWNSGSGPKVYAYHYDPMDRILAAQYSEQSATNTWNKAQGRFQLYGLNYDLNGNIETVTRNSPEGIMDDLTYTYQGNKLASAEDMKDISLGFVDGNPSGEDYTYDASGNLTRDLNKGIARITYNYLNLPETVTYDDGSGIK